MSKQRGALHTVVGFCTAALIHSRIEHVFGEQKSRMGLFIRTIGIARATTKIGLANIDFNMKRLIHLGRIAAVR